MTGPPTAPGTAPPAWYVYVLECRRGVLYTGTTTDVEARFRAHAAGRGAAFTRINPPVAILAAAAFPDRSAATVAEAALKSRSRAGKLRWARDHPWPPSQPG